MLMASRNNQVMDNPPCQRHPCLFTNLVEREMKDTRRLFQPVENLYVAVVH